MVSNRCVLWIGLLANLPLLTGTGFTDDFSSSVLDPAWTVYTYGGPRAYGYPPPANHFSLTDNPGYLRYGLDPMTHSDGYITNYQSDTLHSCCLMDPGIELGRALSGDQWRIEAKGNFYLPSTNGRSLDLRVYFGDGQAGTYFARFIRGRDVNANYSVGLLGQTLDLSLGATYFGNAAYLDAGSGGPTSTTDYWRIARSGGVITESWSSNGTDWNSLFTHDLGTSLNGLSQKVVLTGTSWFNTGGSYVDWDYVNFTDETVPEPGALTLLAAGLAGLGARRYWLRRFACPS